MDAVLTVIILVLSVSYALTVVCALSERRWHLAERRRWRLQLEETERQCNASEAALNLAQARIGRLTRQICRENPDVCFCPCHDPESPVELIRSTDGHCAFCGCEDSPEDTIERMRR